MSSVGKQPTAISITQVKSRGDYKDFLQFPYHHYADDDNWVAPLYLQQKHLVDQKKNPFYRKADAAFFLAREGNRIVGRIAAIHNKAYNEYNKKNTGFFGFFECVDNQFVADLLVKVARDWLKARGLESILGPTNPGMMDEIGVLVDGFDKKPSIMMPYSKPWYDKLLKGAGFRKAMDLFAYTVNKDIIKLERFDRAEQIIMKRMPGLKIRPINLKKFSEEVTIIHDLFNKAWADNWGFYEISKAEFEALGKELKMILDVDIAHIAEIDNKPIGFSIALPNYNQVFQHLKGKLLPTGIFKFMYYRRNINEIRTALMGIHPEYQGRGIDSMLTGKAIEKGLKKGYVASELGWLLETNTHIIRVAERLGGILDKTYRMYEQ